MVKHLAGKVARAIADFLTIGVLIELIEHEMEKRIVARHGLVKLDALVGLTARLKNEIRDRLPQDRKQEVRHLERLIARLRTDLDGSDLSAGRDAFAAHALRLDLIRIVQTWKFMNKTVFGVLDADLREIDAELRRLAAAHPNALAYPGASEWSTSPAWRVFWRDDVVLGDPGRPRVANIYPGLATAGVISPVPGRHPAQDVTIRAVGLAIFLRQVRQMLQAVDRGSEVERLFAEMMVIDYFALWELLFTSGVQNEHGATDNSMLEHWRDSNFKGAALLAALESDAHADFDALRLQVRNKTAAHVDADADIWIADLKNWPITVDQLIDEVLRIIERLRRCAAEDIRSRFFFVPPTQPPGKPFGLTSQEGRRWDEG